MKYVEPPQIPVRIVSTIKKVGMSDYLLTLEEEYLLGGYEIVFKGYYGNLQEAEMARDHARLGLSMETPSAPICAESERFSILIRRNLYWTFAPYLDKEVFAVNLKLDRPEGGPLGPFDLSDSYILEHYSRVHLRNIITYPITIYAVDPEALTSENMDLLTTIIERLRPNR